MSLTFTHKLTCQSNILILDLDLVASRCVAMLLGRISLALLQPVLNQQAHMNFSKDLVIVVSNSTCTCQNLISNRCLKLTVLQCSMSIDDCPHIAKFLSLIFRVASHCTLLTLCILLCICDKYVTVIFVGRSCIRITHAEILQIPRVQNAGFWKQSYKADLYQQIYTPF